MNEIIKNTGEETIESAAKTPSVPMPSRRRLVQAGLAAAPVVLAFSGRSAMAGNSGGTATATALSPVAWVSANPKTGAVVASRTPRASGAAGLSPLKWKPVEIAATFPTVPRWPGACKPFDTVVKCTTDIYGKPVETPITWNASQVKTYSGLSYKNTTKSGAKVDAGWSTGTKLSWLDSRSLSNLLIEEADSGSLKAYVAAAYLNAMLAQDNGTTFLIKPADIQAAYVGKTLGGKTVNDMDLLAYFKQTCA